MNRLQFSALNEFSVEKPQSPSSDVQMDIQAKIRDFIQDKVLGSEDSEIEPLDEDDQQAFSEILKLPDASDALVDQFLTIQPNIDSEQKFKNLAALAFTLLSQAH